MSTGEGRAGGGGAEQGGPECPMGVVMRSKAGEEEREKTTKKTIEIYLEARK